MSEPTAASRCAAPNCRHTLAHGHLCDGHLQRLSDMLREVEEQAAILSALPSMAIRNGSRSGSLASHRAPARLDAIVMRDPRHGTGYSEDEDDALAAGDTLSILNTLHSWARLVREERNYTSRAPITISGERELLTRHLHWIATREWVDELYADLRTLTGQLKAANGHRPDRPLARCVVSAADTLCGGNVWEQEEVITATYADGSRWRTTVPGGPAICDTCGATWATPEDKARLKLMIEQEHKERTRPRTDDGRPMLTANELVDQGYVSSISNVRVIAHRKGATSVGGHYDPNIFSASV